MKSLVALAVLLFAGPAAADTARVVAVSASNRDDVWQFDITVRHGDTGWDHYAVAWEVATPEGVVLGTRTLLHPHVDEQPFTRSLTDVTVPAGVTEVMVRAHDSVHGWGEPVVWTLDPEATK